MIFKAFKEKSNQKYVNTLLSKPKAGVNSSKVKTIAVLLNKDEFIEFEFFRKYFKELNLNSPKHKIVAFTFDEKVEQNQWDVFFTPKDFGWKGKLKSIDLQSFVDEEYDVLVSYYNNNVPYLNQITAMSKANLKVGLSRSDERLYDLIIDIKTSRIDIFREEFKKYLNILNKL